MMRLQFATNQIKNMEIEQYFTKYGSDICFTREQASRFAKQIADDFNPLHDEEAKLFCVPGDLLFAVTLAKQGLSQRMQFDFSGMVSDGVRLQFVGQAEALSLQDEENKTYLSIQREGERTEDPALINVLTRRYVAFSGKNFLNVLVPLMQREGVMINPARPLVIYQRMSIDLHRLDIHDLELELTETSIQVDGKKGDVRMQFHLMAEGGEVGTGEKRMALRGLRPFESQGMDQMVSAYKRYRSEHNS